MISKISRFPDSLASEEFNEDRDERKRLSIMTYRTYAVGYGGLPAVNGEEDWAGLPGHLISGISMYHTDGRTFAYQARNSAGWLPEVWGFNGWSGWGEPNAGTGSTIFGIRIINARFAFRARVHYPGGSSVSPYFGPWRYSSNNSLEIGNLDIADGLQFN